MSLTKSVVISCAGIGSRLGLSKTKALININGLSLIGWQLQLFEDIDDIRIVVGFQFNEVIEEVRKFRKDAVFVFNHNYFETKTAASYYLGARDANDLVIEYDGDLLVHPDDMRKLLNTSGEWVAYSEKNSTDAIYVKTNEKGEVTSFSKEYGDFEWTGPCCLKKENIFFNSQNVFNQIEPFLPIKGIKVRACDIDTPEDYITCQELIKTW